MSIWSTKCFCIDKARDMSGKITGYRLMTTKLYTMDMDPNTLKTKIAHGDIEVANLTLTSDNRLVDKQMAVQQLDMNLVNYCMQKTKQDKDAIVVLETPNLFKASKTCMGGSDYDDAELVLWISPMNTIYASATAYNGRNRNKQIKTTSDFDEVYTSFTA